jgi:hypothetical protein
MQEWFELHAKIDDLRRSIGDKPVEQSLSILLSLLGQIVSRVEHDRLESGQHPLQKSVNESRTTMLTGRVESLETDAQWDRRRIEKKLEAIDAKLEAILQRLPEPPERFDG